MDALHDEVEFVVHLLGVPGDVLRVLGHFQAGSGDAARIYGLAGRKQDAAVLEEVNGAGLAAHVGHLAAAPAAVGLQFLGVFLRKLVLEGARQGDIHGDAPALLAGGELGLSGEFVRHILYFIAVGSTHNQHVVNHFRGNAVRNLAHAVRAADGHHLGAQFTGLGSRAPSYVAKAGEGHFLALDVLAGFLQQVLGEVQGAETGSFRTKDTAAPGAALAGEHAGIVLAGQLLVHAIEIADFTAAHAYVSGRNILVRADAVPQFQHERLAETHDFVVGLPYRVKIRTALGAPHREGGKGILEGLFKAQELEHGRRYGLVETETSLIRADGTVELDAVAGVGLDLAAVVDPGDAESENAVRFHQTLYNLGFLKLRMLVIYLFNGFQYFLHGLQILLLQGILGLKACHDVSCFHYKNGVLVFRVINKKEFASIPLQM